MCQNKFSFSSVIQKPNFMFSFSFTLLAIKRLFRVIQICALSHHKFPQARFEIVHKRLAEFMHFIEL